MRHYVVPVALVPAAVPAGIRASREAAVTHGSEAVTRAGTAPAEPAGADYPDTSGGCCRGSAQSPEASTR